MIISLRSISYEDLKKKLSKDDKIVIWSCDMCIKFCGFAGTERMRQLEDLLKGDGYNVIHKELVGVSCVLDLVRNRKTNEEKKEIFKEATTIIPLTCEDGYDCVKHVFNDKKVISITKTLGVGNFSVDRGPLLTDPFESTGLEPSSQGYLLKDVASKLGLYHTFFDADQEAKIDKVDIIINGKSCNVKNGANLLETCENNGFKIPHLCYKPGLPHAGACRLCLVKIKDRRGLIPSCATEVVEGMEVITEDEELIDLRQKNNYCWFK